jgi:hypothetical protein
LTPCETTFATTPWEKAADERKERVRLRYPAALNPTWEEENGS